MQSYNIHVSFLVNTNKNDVIFNFEHKNSEKGIFRLSCSSDERKEDYKHGHKWVCRRGQMAYRLMTTTVMMKMMVMMQSQSAVMYYCADMFKCAWVNLFQKQFYTQSYSSKKNAKTCLLGFSARQCTRGAHIYTSDMKLSHTHNHC